MDLHPHNTLLSAPTVLNQSLGLSGFLCRREETSDRSLSQVDQLKSQNTQAGTAHCTVFTFNTRLSF